MCVSAYVYSLYVLLYSLQHRRVHSDGNCVQPDQLRLPEQSHLCRGPALSASTSQKHGAS